MVRPSGRAATLLGLLAGVFVVLLIAVLTRVVDGVDQQLSQWVHDAVVHHRSEIGFWRTVTHDGGPQLLGTVVEAVAVLVLLTGRWRLALWLAAGWFGSSLFNHSVKSLVGRARPVLADPLARIGGLSFPSGHAQGSVTATVLLVAAVLPLLGVLGRRVAVLAAVVVALLVGTSRVALGVHFVSDVVAGWALGGLVVLALLTVRPVPRPGLLEWRRPLASRG